MTALFDTDPEPRYCPMCARTLDVEPKYYAAGHALDCRRCGFEYAKAPDGPGSCVNGIEMHGGHTYDNNRCMICDLSERDTLKDRIAALEAIIETDREMTSAEERAIENAAKFISAAVIRTIRDEARQAVIEAVNIPVRDLIRMHASAEQMDADRVEISDRCTCHRCDPFIAID